MCAVDDSAVDQAKEDMEKEQEKVKEIWKESGTYRRNKPLEEEMDREIEEADSK